ncbi:MAG: PH domain-containing protein, partial [Marmoricola sp.]
FQFGERAGVGLSDGGAVEQWFVRAGLVLALLLVIAVFLVIGAVLAVVGYLVANWEFRLSRDALGRSFRSERGLLTRTETSLESARLRGLELGQPLGLRLAGAARLNAIVTGVSSGERSGTLLVPPAPRQVATQVGEAVLDLPGSEPSPLRVPLRPHGSAARRRRLVRALAGAVVVLTAIAAAATYGKIGWANMLPALLLLPLAVWLGQDRYRQLGHALSSGHLVVASGTFRGRRDVLQRSGIIGWNIEESFFQRRAGLCTLIATTAAGKQQYAAIDIPLTQATALATDAVPGLVEQFLA